MTDDERLDLLRECAEGNVTWRDHGLLRRSFRLWHAEDAYTLITRKMKPLAADGLICCWEGIGLTRRGGVDPTAEGWALLRAAPRPDA